MTQVNMTVNGKAASGEVEGRTLLVQFLRDSLNLTGTHVGCDTSQCGACVVHVDGVAVKSCSMLAVEAQGSEVATIEGQAGEDGTLNTIQQAFQDHHGLQCGFLHAGHGDVDGGTAEGQSQAYRGRSPSLSGRQHLPLHGLPQHHQGDHGGIWSGR